MNIGAVQGANGIPSLMGGLLQATMQQSMQLAAQQVANAVALQVSGAALEGLGESIDVYA